MRGTPQLGVSGSVLLAIIITSFPYTLHSLSAIRGPILPFPALEVPGRQYAGQRVDGTVTGEHGEPLALVTVRAFRMADFSQAGTVVQSDTIGRYELSFPSGGPVLVRYDLSCHVPVIQNNLSGTENHSISPVLELDCSRLPDASPSQVTRAITVFRLASWIDRGTERGPQTFARFQYSEMLRLLANRARELQVEGQFLAEEAEQLLNGVDEVFTAYGEPVLIPS